MASSMLAHPCQRVRRRVLDDDAPVVGREDLGVAGDPDDVGVAQHRPEAFLALHGLPVHGLGAP
jgi:hypothetical protein